MKKVVLLVVAAACSMQVKAQTSSGSKPYLSTSSELIFSWGNVEAKSLGSSNYPNAILRFTCFLHIQEQIHFDMSNKAGIYAGLSIRNVGIINDLNDSVKIKQRVYTAGIPVALKLGNMNGTYLALGAEAEFALNYKQKVFVHDEKHKTNIWFSDRTNIFLPSAFVEVHTSQNLYLKFKYYLTDFLVADKQQVNVAGVSYVPTKSQMMYISIGACIPDRKFNKEQKAQKTNNM